MEVSQVHDRGTDQWFLLPAKGGPEAERIYRLVGLRLSRRAVPVEPEKIREVA